jgi:hypothetical protein
MGGGWSRRQLYGKRLVKVKKQKEKESCSELGLREPGKRQ